MADPTGAGSDGGTTTVVANPPNPPTTNTVPNTTNNTNTVVYQSAATNNGGEGFTLGTPDGNGGFVNAQGNPVDASGMPIAGVPPTTYSAPVNDPYAGLTPAQVQWLGNADPTDPIIRARGGLPQLPGATVFATAGFGTLKTGVPIIDSALGTIGSLFTNFSATVGGLFGAKPTATALAAKTGSGVAALEAPVTGPATAKAAVDTNNGGEGFSLGTPDGNGGFVNAQGNPVDSTGMPIAGVPPTTYPAGPTLINGDPFDPQLGVDAAKLSATTSPGNQNLKNIEGATAEIAKNNIEIQNANEANASADQYILDSQTQIAINNTELADPNISDARRAQLEANNAQQALAIDQNQNVIDQNNDRVAVLEKNTQYNEAVAQTNANAYEITGQGGDAPSQVSALEDPSAAAAERNDAANVDALAAAQGERNDAAAVDATQDLQNERNDAAAVDARPGPGESVFDPANVDTNSDPFEQARFDAQQAADAGPVDLGPDDVAVMSDAEADALAEQQAENRRVLAEQATDVEPGLFTGQTDEFGGVDNAVAVQRAENLAANNGGEGFGPVTPDGNGGFVNAQGDPVDATGMPIAAVPPTTYPPAGVSGLEDPAAGGVTAAGSEFGTDKEFAAQQVSQEQGSQEASTRQKAKDQATFQSRYKQPANGDWRARLSISPNAKYLYLADTAGILAPLAATQGVVFPYTPQISTTYSANYEQYDLTHSNYRGLFYKNSRVGDISIRGTFTAQDTREANYLLAVIHFFRSVTKMFYGQDAQRGTPPPICFLNAFGQLQFSDHPCVISAFNYTLPNDVDYIRANNPNNFGVNLANRSTPTATAPLGGGLAGWNRLKNAVQGGLSKGALPTGAYDSGIGLDVMGGSPIGAVQNTAPASYVPTKMEIDITLIPVQSRSQVSKQFSLKDFANGKLITQGFW